MLAKKNKYGRYLAVALAIFIASPLDDIAIAALFGTALFGVGSTSFYLLLIASSTVSILLWKRKQLTTRLKRFSSFLLHKLLTAKKQLQLQVPT